MTFYVSGKPVASLALAMAVLGGCAAYSIEQPTIAMVAPGDERIVFAADDFKGTTSVHVKFTDPWQREEYALFQGNGAQAEILYSTVQTGYQVALEYLFMVDRSVDTWNLSRKYTKSWGETEWFWGLLVGFFYKPYRLVETNRSCFGFSAAWDEPADDPEQRPGKVLFGYYCAKEDRALTRDRMETLLDRIGVRGITERLRSRPRGPQGLGVSAAAVPPDSRIQAEAARLAQGPLPAGDTGNPGFPFDLARYYQVVNGNGGKGH